MKETLCIIILTVRFKKLVEIGSDYASFGLTKHVDKKRKD